jgi:hypothetical protein
MPDLPVTVNLRAYRGDTWAQTFRFIHDDVPIDLTDAAVASWAESPEGCWQLVAAPADDGLVTISMPDPPLDANPYSYDVEVTNPDGTITTWVRGRLTVEQDVTNAGELSLNGAGP